MEKEDECFVPFSGKKASSEEEGVKSAWLSRVRRYGPWQLGVEEDENHTNCLIRLHNEILAFCDLIAMSPDEKRVRKQAIADTENIVKEIFSKRIKTAVFGSELTGLALPSSDIDIVVYGDLPHYPLNILGKAIQPIAKSVELIKSARIPLVKFKTKEDNIAVDISFNVDSGLRTAAVVRRFCEDFPVARPLILVVKQFLAERNLNETYHGGLGSFAVQMMIISFLQMRHRVDCATGLTSANNLASLLLEFFELYGRDLNANLVGISVRDQGSYFNKAERGWLNFQRPSLLAIENPDEPTMDVGKNSYQFDTKIKIAFNHAYSALLAAMRSRHSKCILAAILDPGHPILKGRRPTPGAFSSLQNSLPPIVHPVASTPASSREKGFSSNQQHLKRSRTESPNNRRRHSSDNESNRAPPPHPQHNGASSRHSFSHPSQLDALHRSIHTSKRKRR